MAKDSDVLISAMLFLLTLASSNNYRYNKSKLNNLMAFISRLINKRIANLINRFNVPPQAVDQFENDYPLEATGDHHRFFI